MLGDLVLPHKIDSLGLQDLSAVLGTLAVVEQRSKNLHVLRRLGETTCSAAVENLLLLLGRLGNEWLPVDVVALFRLAGVAWPALMHAGEVLLHLIGGGHRDVLQTQRLNDALLDQVVQPGARGPLENNTRPVDVDAVLPLRTWLVHQRHLVNVANVGVEDIETDRTTVISQLRVEAIANRSARLILFSSEQLTIHIQSPPCEKATSST